MVSQNNKKVFRLGTPRCKDRRLTNLVLQNLGIGAGMYYYDTDGCAIC